VNDRPTTLAETLECPHKTDCDVELHVRYWKLRENERKASEQYQKMWTPQEDV